ncbi:Fic/DOC family protein [Flintibacter porci]|uniref:Fic/DOC family protein n=1 Tax=Flintibacter porci TaxID=3342383 RepID=UPI003F8B91F6
MPDPYFYIDAPVFRNKLGIRDKTTLKRIEAELSRANMMLLYEKGFEDFSPTGLCEIHYTLFGDLYDWAGQYRHIGLEKPEQLLYGRSVWYSSEKDIPKDLKVAFDRLNCTPWSELSLEQFVYEMARTFPPIWQVHPFLDGNTQSVIMMMTFFLDHYGYSMNQKVLSVSSGYIHDAFVLASLDQFSEFELLEQLLMDAVRSESIRYDEENFDTGSVLLENCR